MGISRKLLTGVAILLAVASGHAANFTNLVNLTNGLGPFAGLVLSGNTLFGTTFFGGAGGAGATGGTAFAVATDGSAFTNLHFFGTVPGEASGPGFGSPLVLTNNTLYGMLDGTGGGGGHGALFAMSTDGSITTNVHVFSGSDGIQPEGGLILSGSTLFGTTYYGGGGTIFAVNTNGTGFTNVYRFSPPSFGDGTNSDGANPPSTLLLSGDTLYGVTQAGGINGYGTIFAVSTNGTGFTNLHNFDVYGNNPNGSLILSGNTLYGTLANGGTNRDGMVFAINTNGTGFTNIYIYSFTGGANSDGANPFGGVILSGSTLYGTTRYGGAADVGAVFAVNTDGTGFTNLHNFTGGDGSYPTCVLILSSNTLYGTTSRGGSAGNGTVFSLTLTPTVAPIPLTIQFDGSAATLSWNGPGFSLQSAPSVTGVYSNVAGATSPYTNYIGSSQMFFRLQSN